MTEWSLQDAKNRFSAVVKAARSGEPQRVTRRGKPAVVVLTVEEYERLRHLERAKAPTLAELLLAIPRDVNIIKYFVLALLCVLHPGSVSLPAAAAAAPNGQAEHRVVILAYDTNDVRLPMALDAIRFWNEVAEELELPLRLTEELRIGTPDMRPLENYARSISQRAGRLRGGPNEPDAPEEVTDLDAEAVLLLSRQDLMSFAWPVPRRPGRYFVAIEQDATAMAFNPNIARNILAHELGHTLGLRHNRDPTTLMCGPCQTGGLAKDRPQYMRLTDADRERLVERYASREEPDGLE